MLEDAFENFWKMCFEIYELDPACFLTAPGLAWQVELKNTKGKLDFLTNINMLLMTEKKIREWIWYLVHWYVKYNNKYMKDYDKYKESSYLKFASQLIR